MAINLIDAAIRNVLRPCTKGHMGLQVIYHSQVSGKTHSVTATRGSTSGEAETLDGAVFTHDSYDFKIDSDELAEDDGTLIKPQHLDFIQADIPGTTGWFQVLNDTSNKFAEQLDNWGSVWSINCKVVPPPQTAIAIYGTNTGEAYGTPNGDAYGPPEG